MKIFGWEHVTYLLVWLAVSIAVLACVKIFAKTEKAQKISVKITGGVLLLSILTSRIAQTFLWGDFTWYNFFPTTFCGTSSLVLALAVLLGKKDNCVLHFVWFIALLGGIITSVYPDFLECHNSFFHLDFITSFVHHSLSIVMVVMLLMLKQINITYKKWHYSLFGFCCYLTYGTFLMATFKFSDTFNMFSPILSGTSFTAWVMAPIYFALYGAVILIVELVRRKRNQSLKEESKKA